MDVLEIKGKVNTAICYAKLVEDEAIEAALGRFQLTLVGDARAHEGESLGQVDHLVETSLAV